MGALSRCMRLRFARSMISFSLPLSVTFAMARRVRQNSTASIAVKQPVSGTKLKAGMQIEYSSATVNDDVVAVKPVRKKKRRIKTEEDTQRIKREAPTHWRDMLAILQGIWGTRAAAGDIPEYEIFQMDRCPPHVWRFHILVFGMLSSLTKEAVNVAAADRLIPRDEGLTVQAMNDIDEDELAELIHPVAFSQIKARHIKQVAKLLESQAPGHEVIDIPNNYDDLLELPGVGPKIAHLVMNYAWKK